MINFFKILILTLILTSCKKENEKTLKITKSDFNLKKDYLDFKQKMTALDTIKIWVDYSVCLSSSYEKIVITKKADSIKIKGKFKNETFSRNANWKKTYDTIISSNDTNWNFGGFLKNNKTRMTSENRKYGRIMIKYKKDTIHLFSNGIGDALDLLEQYDSIAEKICPKHLKLTERDIEIITAPKL